MPINSKFSTEVYRARDSLGYTQRQVAEAISVSVRWYQRLEKGEKLPGSVVMLRLILFFNLDIEKFREEVGLIVPISSDREKNVHRR